jgi:hypothetical protein
MTQKTSFGNIPMRERLVFLFFAIFMGFSFIHPIGLPLPIVKETKAYYNYLMAVPDGGVVVWLNGFAFMNYYETGGGEIATYRTILEACRDRGVKFILIASGAEAQSVALRMLSEKCSDLTNSLKYGEDWVFLGYIPGEEAMIRLIARDIRAIATRDYYGNILADMPIMNGIKDMRDYALMGFFVQTTAEIEVRQWWSYANELGLKTVIIENSLSSMVPVSRPFFDKGQINAWINGLRGGAELEVLTGELGLASASIDASSLCHLYAVLLMVGSTAWYLTHRGKK